MSDSNPCVAQGAHRSPAQSALPSHAQDMYSFQKSSLAVPQYSNPASDAQHSGGKLPDYQMPVMPAVQPREHGTNIPFRPMSDGAPVERK